MSLMRKNNTVYKREDCLFFYGQSKSLRNTQQLTTSHVFAFYLFWLITGLGIKTVAAHFEISNELNRHKGRVNRFIC